MTYTLRILCIACLSAFLTLPAQGQSCNGWLHVPGNSWAEPGEIDVTGDKITVEATFNRTTPYTGGYLWAGDLVSKHKDPNNANYLLRPNNAEITTSNGYFATPEICEIELNKTYHVAMTYDGTTLKFYRNGFLMSQVAATGSLYQNNFKTRIGFYEAMIHPESFVGYIDEVRIWNIVRTQNEIRANMNVTLPSPSTQTGLLAYYTFENLSNKQGNSALDLTLSSGANINQANPNCPFTADSCIVPVVIPSFTAPDTVCVNAPVTFNNTTTGASTYYWNFCAADVNKSPIGVNLGNPSSALSWPVFMDYVKVNGNYYGFLINYDPGGLIRLDFGNSLLNIPTAVNLGDFGGIIPSDRAAEGIQIVQNEGKWYAIIVGGYPVLGSNPRVLKIEFGTNITNPSPSATDWGNIGNMYRPIDLHLFKENDIWYGFTVNSENNTITRFNFTNSFDNQPTAINLGNIGNLAYPTGIHVINDNGDYKVFITNGGNGTTTSGVFSITRLDFGNSLLNTPTGVNLGNPNNVLKHPRDLTIIKSCGQMIGFAVNGHPAYRDLVKLDFNNDVSSIPTGVTLGNVGNLGFPHSISKLFRVNDDVYAFVTNVNNNTLTRLRFPGCTNSNISSSTAFNPPPITYNQPGTYNINLTIDDGLPTQSSVCKQVVVLPYADFTFEQDVCNPLLVNFSAGGTNVSDVKWVFHDGGTSDQTNISKVYAGFGNHDVSLSYGLACAVKKTVPVQLNFSDIILTPDTTICDGLPKQLRTKSSLDFCWTPVTYLDDPQSPNPITSTPNNITYHFTAKIEGNNIVTNGNFSSGNTGFSSGYNFTNQNTTEGQYYVGSTPLAWNGSLGNCTDHTGNGNMMMINGSTSPGITIWQQTVNVTPNTNYAFSAWAQSLFAQNPAILQFTINGQVIGTQMTAPLPACTWAKYYATWNSGNTTAITIAITNKNIQQQGNDFALDDISFAPVFIQKDSVIIKVEKPLVQTIDDTIICSQQPVQLNATGAVNYWWAPQTGLTNANIANPIATPTNTTKYIVTGITANGCTTKDSLIITTKPNPVVIMTSDTMICKDAPTQLFASGGNTYQWSPADGLDNANIFNPTVTASQETMYKVLVTGINECSSEDSVKISIRPYPAFTASNSKIICQGTEVQLNAAGGDNYLWSPAQAVTSPSAANPFTTPLTTTNYQVYISENACGYDTTINIRLTVNPVPILTVQKSNDVNCNIPTAQLTVTGALSYNWSPGIWLDDPASATPVAAIDSTTTFAVKGINRHGCTSTEYITVKADNSGIPRFVVPNAFTPNNDGKNDCFGIRRWGNAKIAQFAIYNRWGQLLYETKDPRACWDGTFKGIKQDAGGYIYIIKATTLCGVVTRKGILTLIR